MRSLALVALLAVGLCGDAAAKGLSLRFVGGAPVSGALVACGGLQLDHGVACNAIAEPLLGL